ncbi:hypothetical protein EV356DRAFT_544524 [Viridothelium virens]|uniref:Uncharacterized protein n=1 Tax=Viridothelium virens TaxID=1048519 RepID=A0A6A6HAV9_VIRVR|nr:hypothetical protein EV356DRAFT_544524 [Viridothelium virens]
MRLILLLLLSSSIAATNVASINDSSSLNPCAALSRKYEEQQKAEDNTIAVQQIQWIKNFWQFQSTLAYLKDPPPAYAPPATDIMGGLDLISSNAASGKYQNMYDFELDIYRLVASALDGHFSYPSWLLNQFNVNRTVTLVSVSFDGIEEPKAYNGNASFHPSAVSLIDGEDVTQHILALAANSSSFQDYDALYNSMFFVPVLAPSAGSDPGPNLGSFLQSPSFHHNDTTSYTFENHTTIHVPNIAISKANLNFSSGQELAQMYLLNSPPPSPPSKRALTPSSSSMPTPFVGYPVPVRGTSHPQGYVSGYFLTDTASSDTAVLSITSFDTQSSNDALIFQAAVQNFLAACRSSQKKRLIIDVRQNGGGRISQGFDTFKQLFPTLTPYSGNRIRAFEAGNFLGQEFSQTVTNFIEQDLQDPTLLAQQYGGGDWFAYYYGGYLRSPDGPQYSSWADFYGPLQIHNDNFTHVGSWQLSDFTYTAPLVVSGYGNRSNLPPQVFEGSDIVLLTDGACSSTCATFSNLLIKQGNVTTVTAGGRPNREPIATIGGVQGSNVVSVSNIKQQVSLAQDAIQRANDSALDAKGQEFLSPLASDPPIWPTSLSQCNMNMKDNIARDDASSTPLQFTRSPNADCRFFYMPKDMSSVEYTWSRIANGIARAGTGFCINGTIGHNTGPSSGNSSSTNLTSSTTSKSAQPTATASPPRTSQSGAQNSGSSFLVPPTLIIIAVSVSALLSFDNIF